MKPEDDDEMGDEPIEEEVTEEEQRQRAEQDAKTAAMGALDTHSRPDTPSAARGEGWREATWHKLRACWFATRRAAHSVAPRPAALSFSLRAVVASVCPSAATELREMLDTDDSTQGFFDHKDSVFTIALSPAMPDIVLTGDGDNQAYVWDIATGNRRFHLGGHTDSVIDGGFSPDGKLVATASMDATVRVYNTADGSLRHSLEGPAKELEWMAWHPAGPVIAAGSADETVWMWNADTGACMAVFSGQSGSVTAGAWTADGKTLVTTGESGDLIVWNPKSGEAAIHLKGQRGDSLADWRGAAMHCGALLISRRAALGETSNDSITAHCPCSLLFLFFIACFSPVRFDVRYSRRSRDFVCHASGQGAEAVRDGRCRRRGEGVQLRDRQDAGPPAHTRRLGRGSAVRREVSIFSRPASAHFPRDAPKHGGGLGRGRG